MSNDLALFQKIGHLHDRSLAREAWVYRLALIISLGSLGGALHYGLDTNIVALCFAGMLFIKQLFSLSAQIAKAIDRLANCYWVSFHLSVSPTLFQFHVLPTFKLPPMKLVRLFILPPPAAPSLLTV
jgi:ABC-type iron transport system FetAB permease component